MFQEYKAVGANNFESLNIEVNNLIKEGYEPQGSLVVSQCYIDGKVRVMMAQAMVKLSE